MSVLIVGLILLFLVSALLAWLRRRMLDRQAIRAIIWAFAYAVLILPAIFGYASLVSAGWSADYAITKARIFADGPGHLCSAAAAAKRRACRRHRHR